MVEMLIALVIIGIITAVVITSQSAFNKSLTLSNAAYDLALAIQSAESYGIGSRLVVSSPPKTGYGLTFSPNTTSFRFFADSSPVPPPSQACHPLPPTYLTGQPLPPDVKVGNCAYGASDSTVKNYTLHHGIKISKICAFDGTWRCSTDSSAPITQVGVVFVRPSPAPFFSMNGAYNASVTRACITLQSPQLTERSVAVNITGQIDAAVASCP